MISTRLHTANLIDQIWPTHARTNQILRGTALALIGTLLLIIAAKIQVPLWPVPMTMVTFVVLGLGMIYGWRLAGATMVLYLAQGAIGLPVFSGTPQSGIGLAYMTAGTGGYLIGFVLAAVTVGWLAESGWDRTMLGTVLAMLIGNVVIYVPGVLWLGFFMGWDKPILEMGFFPFILGDVLKLALATFMMPMAWQLMGARSSQRDT